MFNSFSDHFELRSFISYATFYLTRMFSLTDIVESKVIRTYSYLFFIMCYVYMRGLTSNEAV